MSNDTIQIIRPPMRIKYKKFCKHIHVKYRKQYTSYVNGKPSINICALMKILVDKLKPIVNEKYIRNRKYNESDFIEGIIDVIRNSSYWSRYNGKVPGKYLNKRHNDYCRWNVYECLYRIVLLPYYSTHKYNKLHHQSIDSTFVSNLFGCEMYGRNTNYKSKNGVNVTFNVDATGVPIRLAIAAGNRNDTPVAKELMESQPFIETNTLDVKNNNKYRQYLYADAGYDSKELCDILRKKGYTPITDINIRNTKDPKKLSVLKKQKRTYKKSQNKRLKVENCNSWIKMYPKIHRFIEKSIRSYSGLLLLSFSILVSKRLSKD